MLILLAVFLLAAQQDMVEVVLGEEVRVILAGLEDVGNYALVLVLLHGYCCLPRSYVIPRQFDRPLSVLQRMGQLFGVFLGARADALVCFAEVFVSDAQRTPFYTIRFDGVDHAELHSLAP